MGSAVRKKRSYEHFKKKMIICKQEEECSHHTRTKLEEFPVSNRNEAVASSHRYYLSVSASNSSLGVRPSFLRRYAEFVCTEEGRCRGKNDDTQTYALSLSHAGRTPPTELLSFSGESWDRHAALGWRDEEAAAAH